MGEAAQRGRMPRPKNIEVDATSENSANAEYWMGVVKSLRAKRGWSQAELAHHVAVKQGTVSRWERAETIPERSQRMALLKLASFEQSSLPMGDLGAFRVVTVTLRLSSNQMLRDLGVNERFSLSVPAVADDGMPSKKQIVFWIDDQSAAPRYDAGDVIICEDVRLSPEEVIGRECVVELATGEWALKYVFRGSETGRYMLRNANGLNDDNVIVRWCAPVSTVMRGARSRTGVQP